MTNLQPSAPIVDLEAKTPNTLTLATEVAAPSKEQINDNIKRSYKAAVSAVEYSARALAKAQQDLELAEATEREMRPMIRLVDPDLIPARYRRAKKG